MKTPEQSVIDLIKSLREKGLAYNTLMAERARSENGDNDEDDDTVHRSTESIDRDIDEVLVDTMTLARQLTCKDTDGDGDCHECHKTGGCPMLKPPNSSTQSAVNETQMQLFTVVGYYSDTGLRYVGHHAECESALAAIERVANLYSDTNISVVAVIPGEHNDVMDGDYCEDTEHYR